MGRESERTVVVGLESGVMFGFQWFRFSAKIEGGHDVEVRMIYDPKLGLSRTPIGLEQARELFRYSLGAAFGVGGLSEKYLGEQRSFRQMLEEYRESGLPLTVLLAHGGVNARGEVIILGPNVLALDEYRKRIEEMDRNIRWARGDKSKKPSVILMAVCNYTNDPYYKIPDRQASVVYYLRGSRVGLLHSRGELTSSREP